MDFVPKTNFSLSSVTQFNIVSIFHFAFAFRLTVRAEQECDWFKMVKLKRKNKIPHVGWEKDAAIRRWKTRRFFKRNLHKSMRFQAKQPEDFRRTS